MKRLDEELLKKLAIDMVKYQNFKCKSIISKLSYPLKNSTLKNYLEAGVAYIKRGQTRKIISKRYYELIDEAILQHVQPLTPNKFEKRKVYKCDYTKKEQIPQVARLEIVNKPVTATFVYGAKLNNTIRIFESEKEMNLFAEGIKFVGQTVELGTVKFELLK